VSWAATVKSVQPLTTSLITTESPTPTESDFRDSTFYYSIPAVVVRALRGGANHPPRNSRRLSESAAASAALLKDDYEQPPQRYYAHQTIKHRRSSIAHPSYVSTAHRCPRTTPFRRNRRKQRRRRGSDVPFEHRPVGGDGAARAESQRTCQQAKARTRSSACRLCEGSSGAATYTHMHARMHACISAISCLCSLSFFCLSSLAVAVRSLSGWRGA
jgi:hypothetical protein